VSSSGALSTGKSWTCLQGDLIAGFQHLKGAYKKDGDKLLEGPVAIGQGVMFLN